MKRNIAAHVLGVASMVLFCLVISNQTNAQVLEQKVSLQDLAKQLQTPEQIARFMWRHFRFESDQANFGREEYWQSPEEFIMNQKGDCEDFAVFAFEILKKNGKNPFLVNIYRSGYGHTICVFKEKGKYGAIDGTSVIYSESLNGLISQIDPFWKVGAIVASSATNHGKILKQFQRKLAAKQFVDLSA